MSIRYYIAAVFLVLAVGSLALAWRVYTGGSQAELHTTKGQVEADEPDAEQLARLEKLFEPKEVDRADYAVIADKNLFIPARKPHDGPVIDRPGQIPPQVIPGTVTPTAERADVQLMGTTVVGANRLALVRPLRMNGGQTVVVREGDELKDERNVNLPSLKILEIAPNSVTFQESTGQVFAVPLGAQSSPAVTPPPLPNKPAVRHPPPPRRNTPRRPQPTRPARGKPPAPNQKPAADNDSGWTVNQ